MNALRSAMFAGYARSVGLDPEARYGNGAPLRPVVPLDAAVNGVMIVGAYPSARFLTIDGVYGVAAADNLGPFESERWFDGEGVREQPSAQELEHLYLKPLGLQREDCWITDLVKVFLFKPGHRAQYRRLGWTVPAGYERERFDELADASLPWLLQEIKAARPRVLITLGGEVARALRGREWHRRGNAVLGPPYETWTAGVDEAPVAAAHLCHPGLLMRSEGSRWLEQHRRIHVPALERLIGQVSRH